LRTSASTDELLAIAARLATLPLNLPSDPAAHRDAQVLMSAVLANNFDQAALQKFAAIR